MSVNAQQGLVSGVSLVLAPLRAAAKSEQHLRDLAGMVGWDLDRVAGLPIDELTDRLRDLAGAADVLIAGVEHPPQTLLDLLRALDAAQRAFDAAHGLSSVFADGGGPSHFEEFGRDLVELSVTTYLQLAWPVAYHLAVLLTLIEPADEAGLTPAVFDARGNLVRFPHSRPRLQLDRLGDLIGDPPGTLRAEYAGAGGMVTAADARRIADKLFPRIAALLTALGVDAVYGTKSMYGIDLGDPEDLTGGMLTFWVTPAASELGLGATLSLSPQQGGDLGLVISPFGDLRLSGSSSGWELAAELSAGFDAVAFGPRGVQLLVVPAAGAARFTARAVARRGTASEQSTVLVGSTTGSRLELAGVALTGTMILSQTERAFAIELELPSVALVVAPSDGDGFLGAILPADGLRADFGLAIGWSSASGLTFRGSGGLEAQLPVGVAVGPLSVDAVSLAIRAAGSRIELLAGATVGLSLGPVHATVAGVGLRASLAFEDGGNLGVADLALGFKPPTGIALVVDAGPVSGGGLLFFDPEREQYAGAMELSFGGIALKAVGLISTQKPVGFSMLIIISAQFSPIQLGYGFTLDGVGGLIGINRTAAVESLRGGVRDHALDAILFPPDLVERAPQVVAQLGAFFPPAAGRYVIGPMAKIGWGSPTLITIDLGIVLELPEPVRVIVLGRLKAVLPDQQRAVVRLQMDMLGVIDFGRAEASVDATLVDSQIGPFSITGDMALRIGWGANPMFMLSVGGYHPRFQAPPGFPALRRVSVALSDSDNPRLRLEAYLALTSNTFQTGARLELYVKAGGFSLQGMLGFDALVQFDPFGFEVDIAGSLVLRHGSTKLFAVSLDVHLSGPSPWHVSGSVSFSILFLHIKIGFDARLGGEAPQRLPVVDDAPQRLHAALALPESWSAALPAGADLLVTLRARPIEDERVVHPLGRLALRQRLLPLDQQITRLGSAMLPAPTTFTLQGAEVNGKPVKVEPIQEPFAPAQYVELSDAEKLSKPSFVSMTAGATLAVPASQRGATVAVAPERLQHVDRVTGGAGAAPAPVAEAAVQSQPTIAAAGVLAAPVAIAAPGFAVVSADDLQVQSAAVADMAAVFSTALAGLGDAAAEQRLRVVESHLATEAA